MTETGKHAGYIARKDDFLRRLPRPLEPLRVDAAGTGGPNAEQRLKEASAAIARLVRS